MIWVVLPWFKRWLIEFYLYFIYFFFLWWNSSFLDLLKNIKPCQIDTFKTQIMWQVIWHRNDIVPNVLGKAEKKVPSVLGKAEQKVPNVIGTSKERVTNTFCTRSETVPNTHLSRGWNCAKCTFRTVEYISCQIPYVWHIKVKPSQNSCQILLGTFSSWAKCIWHPHI